MIKRAIIYLIALVILTCVFSVLEIRYAYGDLKDYLSILLTVSSMVFTIMGIWIALLYPNALQRLADPSTIETADFSQTLTETKRLEGLVASVLRSAFIVTMIMVIFLSKIVMTEVSIKLNYEMYLKSFVLSLAAVLGILQLESIAHIIYSNIMFINELHSRREDREIDKDI